MGWVSAVGKIGLDFLKGSRGHIAGGVASGVVASAMGSRPYNASGVPKSQSGILILIIVAHVLDLLFTGLQGPIHTLVCFFIGVIIASRLFENKTKHILIMLTMIVFYSTIQGAIAGSINWSFAGLSFDANLWNAILYIGIGLIIALLAKRFASDLDPIFLFTFSYMVFIIPHLKSLVVGLDFLAGGWLALIGQSLVVDFWFFMIPAWWWYLTAVRSDVAGKVAGWINIFLYVVLLLMVLASNFYLFDQGGINGEGVDAWEVWDNTKAGFIIFWSNLSELAAGEYERGVEQFNRDLARAQGKDFESEVEKGAVRDVGLTLGIIEPSQRTIYADQDAVFYADLEAKSFDVEIDAAASCNWTEPRAQTQRKAITSPSEFTIADYYNNRLSCTIPRGQLPGDGGSGYKIQMNASFTYAASAYLERYFTKPGLMKQFRDPVRPPEDLFFQFYGLGSPPRESVRTAGPIDLALSTVNTITELEDVGEQKSFLLRVGLESKSRRWNGELKRIDWILMSIPREFEVTLRPDNAGELDYDCQTGVLGGNFTLVDSGYCAAFDTGAYDTTELDCEQYQHFLLIPSGDHQERLDKDLVVSCRVRPVDSATLLGSAPFGSRSFRARAAFEYGLEQTHFFNVEKKIDESYRVNNPSLYDKSVCDRDILQNVEPNELLNLNYTKYRLRLQELQKMVTNTDSKISDEERQAWNEFDCLEQATAMGLMIQNWEQIKVGVETGFFTLGQSFYGPLRMTIDQMDSVIEWSRNGGDFETEFITELDDLENSATSTEDTLQTTEGEETPEPQETVEDPQTESSNTLLSQLVTNAETGMATARTQMSDGEASEEIQTTIQNVRTTLTSAISAAKDVQPAFDDTTNFARLSEITVDNTYQTNYNLAQQVLSAVKTVNSVGTVQETTTTAVQQEVAEVEKQVNILALKREELEEHGLEYGLGHIAQLIELCEETQQGENGELDLACVVGKYQCGENFEFGNLNSCSNYELCKYCMDVLVPNVYTFARQVPVIDFERQQGNIDLEAANTFATEP